MTKAAEVGWSSLLGLSPSSYEPHPLHRPGRSYTETNCYMDVLIELLHARGDEPSAMLGCTLTVDFEGDQWTFFKPRPGDLELLYGIDVHEMQPYRPLPEQITEQVERGRTMIVEVDSWHLPDTAGISYKSQHVKTSIAVEAIDTGQRRLRYFHGCGFFELEGEDFDGVFPLDREAAADALPPYAELVRLDAGTRLESAELQAAARELLAGNLARRPRDNPVSRFGTWLAEDLPRLLEQEVTDRHAYAFATARMIGAAFDLGAWHVRWLLGAEGAAAAAAMDSVAAGGKTLSFKLARDREFDPGPTLEEISLAWEAGFARLEDALG